MLSFFGKIKNIFAKPNNKKVLVFVCLFVLFGVMFFVEPVKAIVLTAEGMKQALLEFVAGLLFGISSWFIKMTVWISQVFIVIASYSNFINSSAVKLGWVLVRDVVNMFFVVILLVIAFATVLGLEQYEWKKLLVKLVFAAVLVNFSRLICGVIIDVAQVFMMTFVNGFAATAGGNVINGLNLNSLYQFSENAASKNLAKTEDILITGVAAVFFSSISMFVLGAYLIVILARVVTLWTLIVLSPIAFMSSVLPATQKYASEWWKEFNNNVLAGPLLAFFFWLSFAIVGSGNAFQEVLPTDNSRYATEGIFADTSSGVAKAMDWGAMASFAIAIALLMTGVKKTQELGVSGASALGKAMSTATRVAKVASGVAAVGWGAGKVVQGGKWAAKGVAMKMPIVGGDSWKRRGQSIKAGVGAWYDQRQEKIEEGKSKRYKDAQKNYNESKGIKKVGAWFVKKYRGAALSEAQKEKEIQIKMAGAKAVKEQREINYGMGATDIGKDTGEKLMSLEIVKEQASEDKRKALAPVKVNKLYEKGKIDEAMALESRNAAAESEIDTKMYSAMTKEDLGEAADRALNERKQAAKEEEIAAAGTDDEAKKKALEKLTKLNDKVTDILVVAGEKGSVVYEEIRKRIDASTGNEDDSSENASLNLAGRLTGANTNTDEGKKAAQRRLDYVENDKSRIQKQEYKMRRLKEVGEKMAKESPEHSNLAKAMSVEKTTVKDKNGNDILQNGSKIYKTKARIGSATADGGYFKNDEKVDGWYTDNSTVKVNGAIDANSLLKTDGKVDVGRVKPVSRALSQLLDNQLASQLKNIEEQLIKEKKSDSQIKDVFKEITATFTKTQRNKVKENFGGDYVKEDTGGGEENLKHPSEKSKSKQNKNAQSTTIDPEKAVINKSGSLMQNDSGIQEIVANLANLDPNKVIDELKKIEAGLSKMKPADNTKQFDYNNILKKIYEGVEGEKDLLSKMTVADQNNFRALINAAKTSKK